MADRGSRGGGRTGTARSSIAFEYRPAAPAAGLGALGAEGRLKLKGAADRVTLGRTGQTLWVLGMGTGSTGVGHSCNQVRLGEAGFTRLVRHAYDRGITYFDAADQYGSHI